MNMDNNYTSLEAVTVVQLGCDFVVLIHISCHFNLHCFHPNCHFFLSASYMYPVYSTEKLKVKAGKSLRTSYTKDQLSTLEEYYQKSHYIDSSTKRTIAAQLNLTAKQVTIWFQNRRSRDRRITACSVTPTSDSTKMSSPLVYEHIIVPMPSHHYTAVPILQKASCVYNDMKN